jgi:hypothetical protein
VASERQFSDVLLSSLLKSHSDRYRYGAQVNVDVGIPDVTELIRRAPPEVLAEMREKALPGRRKEIEEGGYYEGTGSIAGSSHDAAEADLNTESAD